MILAVIHAAARFLTRVAAVFLISMVAINIADVGLRSSINAPIFGTYEIVELMLAAVAFLAIPETFLRGEHITIELIDQVVSKRVSEWLQVIGTLAALIFITLLAYHMIQPAMDFVMLNEVTVDLQIPLIWKAVLIFIGIAASIIAVGVVFIRELLKLARSKT
ncbi:MAG: TRAP transporter small permease [Rhodospirillales bacterium]|nr:TRAP transporter small permease [Rhodospirillales bacterium]